MGQKLGVCAFAFSVIVNSVIFPVIVRGHGQETENAGIKEKPSLAVYCRTTG